MNINKVMLATLVATAAAMVFAVLPTLSQQQASANPAPKTEEGCNDPDHPQFDDRPSCPGKSEDATGGGVIDREDECIARNNGQAKHNDCEETEIVNPPQEF